MRCVRACDYSRHMRLRSPRPCSRPLTKVLWVFAVASPDGRSFLQLFLDLDILCFCLRGSSVRGEVRFKTPSHLVCGGARVWHHVVLSHARPKSRILGTREKLCLWVDGELADSVKVSASGVALREGMRGGSCRVGDESDTNTCSGGLQWVFEREL